MDAIEEKAFILKDKKLRNLNDLYSAIAELSDEEYSHYVSLHHNYFADWVQYVLEQRELADGLRSTDLRIKALQILSLKLKKETEKENSYSDIKVAPKKESKAKIDVKNDNPEDQKLSHHVLSKDYSQMDTQEMKHLLWHHHPWEMAKEFMYGMAIGIIIGLILSRIILP